MKNSEVLEHLRLARSGITEAIYELDEINANMSVAELKRVRERVDELIDLMELEDEAIPSEGTVFKEFVIYETLII